MRYLVYSRAILMNCFIILLRRTRLCSEQTSVTTQNISLLTSSAN